jgi:hypothetical protein
LAGIKSCRKLICGAFVTNKELKKAPCSILGKVKDIAHTLTPPISHSTNSTSNLFTYIPMTYKFKFESWVKIKVKFKKYSRHNPPKLSSYD